MAADVNGDGRTDLIIGCDYSGYSIHRNAGAGEFQLSGEGSIPSPSHEDQVRTLDIDNDGDLDIVMEHDTTLYFFYNLNGTLSAAPSSLNFTARSDSVPPAPQKVQLLSERDTVKYSITELPAWLNVRQLEGVTPAELTFVVDPLSVSPGIYKDTVQIVGYGAVNSPHPIEVTFSYVGSIIRSEPAAIDFEMTTTEPAPSPVTLAISSDQENLSFDLSKSASWLKVAPTSGTTPMQVSAEIDTSGLQTGIYTDTIRVTTPRALNSSLLIPVRFSYLPPTADVFPYPVPVSTARGSISYVVESPAGGILKLKCYNAALMQIKEMEFRIIAGHNDLLVDIGGLAPGVYMYEYVLESAANVGESRGSGKFIVVTNEN
jgi:hypothetical protein